MNASDARSRYPRHGSSPLQSPGAMAPQHQQYTQVPYHPQQHQLHAQPGMPSAPGVMGPPHHQMPSIGPMGVPLSTPFTAPQNFQSVYYRRPNGQQQAVPLGAGNVGADSMHRIIMALECGIPSEIEWAVSALLQISYQSPEFLQFKQIPSLVPLILERIDQKVLFATSWVELDVKHSSMAMQKSLELLLALRNIAQEPENAYVLANTPDCVSLIERGLGVKNRRFSEEPVTDKIKKGGHDGEATTDEVHVDHHDSSNGCKSDEARLYLLELCEMLSPHLAPESPNDGLFQEIIHLIISTNDRATVMSGLKILTRMAAHEPHNIIGNVPDKLVHRTLSFLLTNDEALISATLDFLYQFSFRISNVSRILESGGQFVAEICTTRLIKLMSLGCHRPEKDYMRLPRAGHTEKPPYIPDWILDELKILNEPQRATYWIRAAYEDYPEGEVTQVSLWKAYEAQFLAFAKQGKKLLPAVDFIKNVTSAFPRSAAMVVNLPDGRQRFIIKGIRPRLHALAPSEHKRQMEEQQKVIRDPPTGLNVSAALVLQNVARSLEGRQLLKGRDQEFVAAMELNPTLALYVDFLLDTVYSVGDLS